VLLKKTKNESKSKRPTKQEKVFDLPSLPSMLTQPLGLEAPEQFGMQPEKLSTACYRGFFATYEVADDGLYLQELTLREANDNYKPINGIHAEKQEYQATYQNFKFLVTFSGKLRLARDFVKELYVHMGFQKPTAFKTLYDLALEDGRVVEIKDRSKEMEMKRGAFKKHYESGNRINTIHQAFTGEH
jgi:hypothetical protein